MGDEQQPAKGVRWLQQRSLGGVGRGKPGVLGAAMAGEQTNLSCGNGGSSSEETLCKLRPQVPPNPMLHCPIGVRNTDSEMKLLKF